jgi:hypothetical protein
VAEVITVGGAETLEEFLEPDDKPGEPAQPGEPAKPRWKKSRDAWEWEEEARSFNSREQAIFPGQNYIRFKNM